jgi:hypothetical protein
MELFKDCCGVGEQSGIGWIFHGNSATFMSGTSVVMIANINPSFVIVLGRYGAELRRRGRLSLFVLTYVFFMRGFRLALRVVSSL